MKIDDMLKEILAEAEDINPDTVAQLYGASAVMETQYFALQKRALTQMVELGLFDDATDPPRVMVIAALNILKHSFTQAMANLVMIDALDPKDVETSIEPILHDLKLALHDAAEEALRVAADPQAHGFEEHRGPRGKG